MSKSYRCFRCGRDLSNETSVELGIGPICRGKRAAEESAEDQQRKSNLTCHKGFTCYAPDHAGTLIGHFIHRFNALVDQTDPVKLAPLAAEIIQLITAAGAALGLDRPRVPVPDIKVPVFGQATIGLLGIPARRAPSGGMSWAMPADHDDQFRRICLRIDQVCPFGLDCQQPERAVQNIWRVLSILRYDLEPQLATEDHCGWAWDRLLYQHLWNVLEVLGCEDDARDIQAIVEAQASQPVALRLFAGEEVDQ